MGGRAEGQRKWVPCRGDAGPRAGLPRAASCPGHGVPAPTCPFQGDGQPLWRGVPAVSGSWGTHPPGGTGLLLHEMGLGGPGLWSVWSEALPPHPLTPPSAPALLKLASRSALGPRLQHCWEAGLAFSASTPCTYLRPAHTPPREDSRWPEGGRTEGRACLGRVWGLAGPATPKGLRLRGVLSMKGRPGARRPSPRAQASGNTR